MWQLEQYDAHQKKGLAAIEAGDFRLARFHLLKAAEYVLKAAQKSGPDFQQMRQEQSRKLVNLARQCEEKMRAPVAVRVGGGSGGAGSSTGGGAATSTAAQGSDKNLTEFRPLAPGDTKMSDVVGLDEVKRQVRLKVIYPLQHPEIVTKYRTASGGGILLYGPPGTGKTMIAQAIAGEVDAPFYNVKPSDILAPLVGVAERNIARLFEVMRAERRAVLFLDEIDALLPARGADSGSNVMGRLVPQFLQEMQGITAPRGEDKPGEGKSFLLLLAATNCPWAIDPAVMRPGRFDELIYIDLPDAPARRVMFEKYLEGRPLADDVSLDHLAARSEGYSGADVRDICDTAAELVLEVAIERGEVQPIGRGHLEQALARARRSVHADHLERFEEFRQR